MRIWYMRDNHTFKLLSADPKTAKAEITEEFERGYTYGMLFTRDVPIRTEHASGNLEQFLLKVDVWYADMNDLKEKHEGPERGLVCVFCGEGFGYVGETPTDEELEQAVNHEKKCPKNPYIAKIDRLKSELKDMTNLKEKQEEEMAWLHKELEELEELKVEKHEGPECEDGPEFEGWEERSWEQDWKDISNQAATENKLGTACCIHDLFNVLQSFVLDTPITLVDIYVHQSGGSVSLVLRPAKEEEKWKQGG